MERQAIRNRLAPGVVAALTAAALFGIGTPLAKLLLSTVSPWMLAGLLYLGSGLGLALYRWIKRSPGVSLPPHELPWFIGAVTAGGVAGPVLLMLGLVGMPASGASLLLNAEAVFTAIIAWFVFKENFDKRIALGMVAIVAGAVVLSWSSEARLEGFWSACAVLAACLAWGIDNNLTRKVSLTDASWIACVKGLVAGSVNLGLALVLGAAMPSLSHLISGLVLGFFAYGVSLALFVVALRHLGSARTGAYFSVAPFLGAVGALAMGEPLTLSLIVAGALMATGIWLHLTEHHEHLHTHPELEHEHEHVHDLHHQHDHPYPIAAGVRHNHVHRHTAVRHFHPHYPDAHHQHDH
ncbi:DMT family transporter [Phyllobacterium bourgognense]|uniref:DMT family transporter n=1 Tax=Phyllobacterium bourgognense TaxID=314236 RepID=UPI000DF13B6A|nr:DMT family transporter [Phyllobacterium bourgognense]